MDETSSSSSSTENSSSNSSTEYSSSLSTSVKLNVTKTKTNKRKLMLFIEGYNFQFKSFNKNKTIKFWWCADSSCGMILHTNLDDEFIRFTGKVTDQSHLPNPVQLEIRNSRETMRERAENELLLLQEIAEQEIRKALLTAEALVALPHVTTIGMILIFLCKVNSLICFLFMFLSGHNLIHNRWKMNPHLLSSSSFFIPDIYTKDYHNNARLLLHDSDDPKFQINQLENVQSTGRILVWSSDIQLKLLFHSERHVKSVGLSSADLDNLTIRSVIRKIMALALVPERHIPSLFARLGQELSDAERDEIADLFKYFNDH
ncbi:unnamed protein product [Rotaria sp. Silwood2]|nr:unnamed protein product [Rotaria sp. Silwood2]CAF3116230.1 unnamed protein product [Rotaria sp. Silwood2]CAF3155298.1 unnamed protein product [Rotaria sp. Silwood2]CAF3384956.1 unnamed protein product [Rotaria sp. Silwood2]CAF4204764.1 unnamed protein product [Rotaria sp. Silwood2]